MQSTARASKKFKYEKKRKKEMNSTFTDKNRSDDPNPYR
jgi:hypothetical protein